MPLRNAELVEIEDRAGIIFPGAMDWLPRAADGSIDRHHSAVAGLMAMDAGTQPTLVTTANAGIPSFLSTWMDPQLVEVILQPNRAAEAYGETRKGDWLMETAGFPMIESTGEVSSYGDYSTNGRSGANAQWEWRQSYLYQTFTEWGERELERMGLARIDWAARQNIASAINLNKFQNKTYFFGVPGIQNYGGLNDPSLPALLTPTTKTAGGTAWTNALPTEILADIQKCYAQLQVQLGQNLTMSDRFTILITGISETYLANTNSFGLTAKELINSVFPNIRFVIAPELGTPIQSPTTYNLQMFADEVEGQRTVEVSFNEKMRAHRIVQSDSSWRQKKTQGTWGAIVKLPAAFTGLTGI